MPAIKQANNIGYSRLNIYPVPFHRGEPHKYTHTRTEPKHLPSLPQYPRPIHERARLIKVRARESPRDPEFSPKESTMRGRPRVGGFARGGCRRHAAQPIGPEQRESILPRTTPRYISEQRPVRHARATSPAARRGPMAARAGAGYRVPCNRV